MQHQFSHPLFGITPGGAGSPVQPPDNKLRCHAGSDGDCIWAECPQEKDNRAEYRSTCKLLDERDYDDC